MKNILFCLAIIAFISNQLFAVTKDSTEIQHFRIEKLAATCKVWGFLKYYHPKVAAGEFNWDEKLFEILPEIEAAQNKKEFSATMEHWLQGLGKVDVFENKIIENKIDYFDKNFDLSWIEKNQLFSKNLQQQLRFVEKNRINLNTHYVDFGKITKSLSVTNEAQYPEFSWNNQNLRILMLFRYWNYIEYFFPYKYQIDKKWDKILKLFIPKFAGIQSEVELHLTVAELIANLNDSHATLKTNILDSYFGNKWIAAKIKIIDSKVVIAGIYNDSLAKIDDICVGDVVTKVNGENVDNLIQSFRRYFGASNIAGQNRNLRFALLSGNTSKVQIEFKRNNIVVTKMVQRYTNEVLNIAELRFTPWQITGDNIGIVNLNALKLKINTAFKELSQTKAIILDLRNGSSIELPKLAGFLNSKEQEFVKFTFPDLSYPGRFIWQKSRNCGSENPDFYKGKVIVLVNEFVQSSYEYLAMGLQTSPNITVMGTQTAGANGDICTVNLFEKFPTRFSSLGVFYPNKEETQRLGIKIDVEVKQTISGINAGKDELLENAINFINRN